MHRLVLLASVALVGCAGPALTLVTRDQLREGVPSTTYGFDGGATLRVVEDQGVGAHRLERADDGFVLTWEASPLGGASGARTLRPEGATVRIVEDRVTVGPALVLGEFRMRPGASPALLLQGNGEARVTETDGDLERAYGANALAYLGVVLNADTVMTVVPDSPAAAAGLQVDDVLSAAVVDGERCPLKDRADLARLLPRLRPGERVALVVSRQGDAIELPVVLGRRPAELWNKTDG